MQPDFAERAGFDSSRKYDFTHEGRTIAGGYLSSDAGRSATKNTRAAQSG